MNLKNRFLFVAFLIISAIANAQSPVKLFNGKDLKGWYAYGEESGKLTDASELFHVDNQMIRLYGNKAGYLMSGQSFHDFQLTVEFRWNTDTTFVRKNNRKNSGVMYLVPTNFPDTLWPKGIQFQIKEGATGDFILLQKITLQVNGEEKGPGRSVVVNRLADATKSIGEWNTLVVTHKDGKVRQKLNGKLVNEGSNPSVSEGRILLQYEGFPSDFRKVEIKEL
jgi:hypothetical protein